MQDTGNQLFTESVLDEVMISLPKNTENEKERATEILKKLDLEPFLERHPQSLSGGQKQRLAIACVSPPAVRSCCWMSLQAAWIMHT